MKTETLVDIIIVVTFAILSTAIAIVLVELLGQSLVRDVKIFLKIILTIVFWCLATLIYLSFRPDHYAE